MIPSRERTYGFNYGKKMKEPRLRLPPLILEAPKKPSKTSRFDVRPAQISNYIHLVTKISNVDLQMFGKRMKSQTSVSCRIITSCSIFTCSLNSFSVSDESKTGLDARPCESFSNLTFDSVQEAWAQMKKWKCCIVTSQNVFNYCWLVGEGLMINKNK